MAKLFKDEGTTSITVDNGKGQIQLQTGDFNWSIVGTALQLFDNRERIIEVLNWTKTSVQNVYYSTAEEINAALKTLAG